MSDFAVSVKGGLPVIADCWWSGPDWQGEYDAGVDALYWMKRDGTRGAQLSEKAMAKIEKADPYWECHALEQAEDQLAQERAEASDRPDTIQLTP